MISVLTRLICLILILDLTPALAVTSTSYSATPKADRSATSTKKAKIPTDFEKADAAYKKDDFATALMLWFPLAEKGDADAQFSLGKMYLEQKGQRKDPAEAAEWVLKAAQQNHIGAQTLIGQMHLKGVGVKRNFNTAANWFLKAARQKDKEAQYILAKLYYYGD